MTQTPVLADVIKMIGGIAPQRRLPRFAPKTFKQWFGERAARNQGKAKVILWPDTFNNHFFPQVGGAAVEVLEAAGYQVVVPGESLCCGRPLYDFGMLDAAGKLLEQVLGALKPYIENGIPVVGLEPSCVAVFRDEMVNLFPNNENAKRLSRNTYLLSEFLEKVAGNYEPPKLHRKALAHGHCHHKAVMRMDDEDAVLGKLGLDYEILDSGCCGMAGSFGFEKEHYDVSIAVGEHELLPAVRKAAKDTIIIADGFSCREQIAQTTDRKALHLAQVIQMAMREGPAGPPGEYPESVYANERSFNGSHPAMRAAGIIGAGALLGIGLWWSVRKLRSK